MKITIVPANTRNSVVIEGSDYELRSIVQMLLGVSTPTTILPTTTPKPVQTTQVSSETPVLHNATDFVSSLYVYKADTTKDNGRGRWIAERLATGKRFSIMELATKSEGTRMTVTNVIQKMSKAGAQFIVQDGFVQLIHIPNKTYKPARRSDYKAYAANQTRKKATKTKSKDKVLTALSGRKIKA